MPHWHLRPLRISNRGRSPVGYVKSAITQPPLFFQHIHIHIHNHPPSFRKFENLSITYWMPFTNCRFVWHVRNVHLSIHRLKIAPYTIFNISKERKLQCASHQVHHRSIDWNWISRAPLIEILENHFPHTHDSTPSGLVASHSQSK